MTWPEYCERVKDYFADDPDFEVEINEEERIITIHMSEDGATRKVKSLCPFAPYNEYLQNFNAHMIVKID